MRTLDTLIVALLHRGLQGLRGMRVPKSGPTTWRDLRAEFSQLKSEEEAIIRQQAPRQYMRAHGQQQGGICFEWTLASAASEGLREGYELAATYAGRLVGTPPGEKARDWWLDRLYLYLCANQSSNVRPGDKECTIDNLCEVSCVLCLRLERAEVDGDIDKMMLAEIVEVAMPRIDTDSVQANQEIQSTATAIFTGSVASAVEQKTIGAQIADLRLECDWTVEHLAELIDINVRSVMRHVAEQSNPSPLNIARYERVFSQKLGKKVVIRKMS